MSTCAATSGPYRIGKSQAPALRQDSTMLPRATQRQPTATRWTTPLAGSCPQVLGYDTGTPSPCARRASRSATLSVHLNRHDFMLMRSLHFPARLGRVQRDAGQLSLRAPRPRALSCQSLPVPEVHSSDRLSSGCQSEPFRVEMWDPTDQHIRWVISASASVFVSHAAMDAAIANYPDQRFTLRNGIQVIRQHPPTR